MTNLNNRILKKIQAIIFDQGNTLLDVFFNTVIKNLDIRLILQKYNIPCTNEEFLNAWIKADKHVNFSFISHIYQETNILHEAFRILGIRRSLFQPLSIELLSLYRKKLRKDLEDYVSDGSLRHLLLRLKRKGKILGIFSNDRAYSLQHNMKVMYLDTLFNYSFSSEEIGHEKPSYEFFSFIHDKVQVPKINIVYIGDSYENDIVGAKNYGFRSIHYIKHSRNNNKKYLNDRTKPDSIINELALIDKIIR